MNKLTNSQKVAKVTGVKDGPNTWFGSDIANPDNQNVKIKPDTSIAIGAVKSEHLLGIVTERFRACLPKSLQRGK
jgi:hypothetical protein